LPGGLQTRAQVKFKIIHRFAALGSCAFRLRIARRFIVAAIRHSL
jgi:hypothetical protein